MRLKAKELEDQNVNNDGKVTIEFIDGENQFNAEPKVVMHLSTTRAEADWITTQIEKEQDNYFVKSNLSWSAAST